VSDGGRVTAIDEIRKSPIRINGGFCVSLEIFEHMRSGEELVCEPFQRLVGQLAAYEYDGFWMSMDTFKDRQQLEDIYDKGHGHAPWEVWNHNKVSTVKAYAGV
jgi:glucose-1-phosphate cytidylyltransferase